MKNGIYFAKFDSNMSDWGNGIITIRENKVNGGDFGCFYRGEIKESKIILHLTQHSVQNTSVFGDLKEFDLDIKEIGSNLEADGKVVGQPQLKFKFN
ncbi:hypothetical protein J3U16_06235 [Gilliamella sp. B3023]|uniref:GrlR family regulatory protein n=1 Tax=unclassified Gilliamella TaxID=2685620 RepID=UPI002269934B|nr:MULTISPECIES: GrlR family regulatory protein [unclassified Gilliamella]MCX8585140.1 hypothetical protein [Gilliamella sp. B3562]MCX8674886.1 hypothetical protein [Gilliamella sp. B3023]MCX8685194.1 hypothetical protein [Gilliamella sp. B2864]